MPRYTADQDSEKKLEKVYKSLLGAKPDSNAKAAEQDLKEKAQKLKEKNTKQAASAETANKQKAAKAKGAASEKKVREAPNHTSGHHV